MEYAVKKLVFLLLLCLSCNIYAENFEYLFNIGNAGIGLNYPSDKGHNAELYVELLNFGINNTYANMGIGFNLMKYWLFEFEDETNHRIDTISFANFDIHWNMLYNSQLFFGIFATINYMFLNNYKDIVWNEYIFTTGIRFAWTPSIFEKNIYHQFFCSEIGYRNSRGNNLLYVNINIDVLVLLYSLGQS
jgi:hypothetical protein